MPRTGRVVLPDHPHHIVLRGHNRQVVFAQMRILWLTAALPPYKFPYPRISVNHTPNHF